MASWALVDTSYLYALFNRADANHKRARDFAIQTNYLPLIPDVILPEVTFLFMRDIGHHGVIRFLKEFAETQPALISLIVDDVVRAHQVMDTYHEAAFDFVDCCIMALSERLGITDICTFDLTDFRIYRPTHSQYFTILP